MNSVSQPVLEFHQARFESLHSMPSGTRGTGSAQRGRLRATWLPPALVSQLWKVSTAFEFWTGSKAAGAHYIVDADFEFDGASVPWPLTVFVPKTHPIYLGAAALHDFLYQERHAAVARKTADDVFLEALMVSGLNWVWAGLMWRAVRAAGWVVWYKRKPDTWLGWLLGSEDTRARILRIPAIVTGVAVKGVLGILSDTVLLGAVRIYLRSRAIGSVSGG